MFRIIKSDRQLGTAKGVVESAQPDTLEITTTRAAVGNQSFVESTRAHSLLMRGYEPNQHSVTTAGCCYCGSKDFEEEGRKLEDREIQKSMLMLLQNVT